MAFSDSIRNYFTANDQNASGSAGEIKRLEAQIEEEKNRINYDCYQIGIQYVNVHADDYEESFGQWMQDIRISNEKIAELTDQILFLKGIVLCAKCGGENPSSAAFCNACGAPIERKAPPGTVFCRTCGNPVNKELNFCTVCGTPVPHEEQPSAAPAAQPAAEPAPAPVPEPVPEPVPPVEEIQQPMVEEPTAPVAETPAATPAEPVADTPAEPPVEEPVPEPTAEEPAEALVEAEQPPVTEPAAPEAVVQPPVRKKVCPSCGCKTNDPEDMFCCECGSRLVLMQEAAAGSAEPAVPVARFCPNCGYADNEPDAIFCIECGTRIH